MRLASFTINGRTTWGRVEDDRISDLSSRWPTLKSALGTAPAVIAEACADAPTYSLADIAFAPVIPDPAKILCVGHNYETHRIETGRDKTGHPSIFTRFADTLVGHEGGIVRPPVSDRLDYEGELLVVIGAPCFRVEEREALRYVAGYSCFNDASVRDWQWHSNQFTPGKNFPSTGGVGPWMVTADEIGDPAGLSVTTRLNGEVMQSQPTADMAFSIAEIISYASTFTRLLPGDLIATGTPGGVGAKRTPPVWMKPGDRVEIDIPGVGLLVNRIVAEG